MEHEKGIAWLIDENQFELDTHRALLSQMLSPEMEVRGILAYATKNEYIRILQDAQTICVIIDQRLKQTGIATYTGIELAIFLRSINSKVPIYILTNYPEDDEFDDGEWSVEDIIPKEDMTTRDRRQVLNARLRRRFNTYDDIRTERASRFRSLLKQSMDSELSRDDLRELDELNLERATPILADELTEARQLAELLETHRLLIDRFGQPRDPTKDGTTDDR